MKKFALSSLLLFFAINLYAQISYIGFIDKYPIELVLNPGEGIITDAFYVYSKFDEPILLDGALENGILDLFEKDSAGNKTASFNFRNFSYKNQSLSGIWKNLKTQKELPVTLSKISEITEGENDQWSGKELLQPASLKGKYFKIILRKEKGSYSADVTGIKLYEKRTDKLLQQFEVNCQLLGLNNIGTGDFNFDGYPDFSMFEMNYSGSNTSSIYFLYDPVSGSFFKSEFEGSSSEFDSEKKRIFEHNQCCAGQKHMTAEYKVVNNKMVLIKRECLEYNEEKGDYIEVKCD